MATEMVPPQLNSRLGVINPGLTLTSYIYIVNVFCEYPITISTPGLYAIPLPAHRDPETFQGRPRPAEKGPVEWGIHQMED